MSKVFVAGNGPRPPDFVLDEDREARIEMPHEIQGQSDPPANPVHHIMPTTVINSVEKVESPAKLPTVTLQTNGMDTEKSNIPNFKLFTENGALNLTKKAGTHTTRRFRGLEGNGERLLMREWLEIQLEAGDIPGFHWRDKEAGIFQIPWKHAAHQGWAMSKDALLFKRWAEHTGKPTQGTDDANLHKRWKANFRCAINSLPDVKELKAVTNKKGLNAAKVYQFLKAVEHRKTPRRVSTIQNVPIDLSLRKVSQRHRRNRAQGISRRKTHIGISVNRKLSKTGPIQEQVTTHNTDITKLGNVPVGEMNKTLNLPTTGPISSGDRVVIGVTEKNISSESLHNFNKASHGTINPPSGVMCHVSTSGDVSFGKETIISHTSPLNECLLSQKSLSTSSLPQNAMQQQRITNITSMAGGIMRLPVQMADNRKAPTNPPHTSVQVIQSSQGPLIVKTNANLVKCSVATSNTTASGTSKPRSIRIIHRKRRTSSAGTDDSGSSRGGSPGVATDVINSINGDSKKKPRIRIIGSVTPIPYRYGTPPGNGTGLHIPLKQPEKEVYRVMGDNCSSSSPNGIVTSDSKIKIKEEPKDEVSSNSAGKVEQTVDEKPHVAELGVQDTGKITTFKSSSDLNQGSNSELSIANSNINYKDSAMGQCVEHVENVNNLPSAEHVRNSRTVMEGKEDNDKKDGEDGDIDDDNVEEEEDDDEEDEEEETNKEKAVKDIKATNAFSMPHKKRKPVIITGKKVKRNVRLTLRKNAGRIHGLSIKPHLTSQNLVHGAQNPSRSFVIGSRDVVVVISSQNADGGFSTTCLCIDCHKNYTRGNMVMRRVAEQTGGPMLHCDVCQKLFSETAQLTMYC